MHGNIIACRDGRQICSQDIQREVCVRNVHGLFEEIFWLHLFLWSCKTCSVGFVQKYSINLESYSANIYFFRCIIIDLIYRTQSTEGRKCDEQACTGDHGGWNGEPLRRSEADFKEAVGDRISKYIEVSYVYQALDALPQGYEVPEGRVKPWGTAHAVLCCADEVNGPFAVINADDYYGKEAFQLIYDYLSEHEDDELYRYTMVGYQLGNTVTGNGHVARGICDMNEDGELIAIHERTRIEKRGGGIAFTEDDGATWTEVPKETTVSMNMWGFTHSILKEIKAGFPAFLDAGLKRNPMKCEYFLPAVVSGLVEEKRASVAVLKSADKWYGVTYKEDKPVVENAVREMKDKGLYPEHLWEEK